MRAAWFVTTEPPACVFENTFEARRVVRKRERQLGGVVGAGFGFAVPLRPRRAGFGAAGGIGPASAPGSAGGVAGAAAGSAGVAGVAGVTGAAGVSGTAAGFVGLTGAATGSATGAGSAAAGAEVRRALAARAVLAGVNEQACVAPSTLVSVSRSRDFFARSETMVGTTAG